MPDEVGLRTATSTYRIVIEPAAPAATPWQADTLWGHLCWALVRRRGESALQSFLQAYRDGVPPLVLSDGFAEGRLPRPLALPPPATGSKREAILTARAAKAAGRTAVGLATFDRLRRGESVPLDEEAAPVEERRVLALRNSVDRLTGTAGGAGGALYTVEEYHARRVDLYLRVTEETEDLIWTLLADLAVEGYGKRRAVGYGAIARWQREPFDGFAPFAEANAFLSLSRFSPAADDPTDGMWRTAVKVGTVGGETASPFKRPLVLLTAGSWFRVPGGGREWYGRLVSGLSAAHPEAVQYALAFAVPVRVLEDQEL
jgi:CRISPR-associated protein Csm4